MQNNTESKELSPEASLKIIYEMIESTRTKIGKNYLFYLLWGYLVAATCIIEYVLITVHNSSHYMVWPIFMSLGSVISLIIYFVQKKERTGRTFIGSAMETLWFGWFITLVLLIIYMVYSNNYSMILPVVMAMYGLASFVTGGVVSFKWLIFSGIVAWVVSLVSFFVTYQIQLALLTGMVIFAYIIPGHILKNKSKN